MGRVRRICLMFATAILWCHLSRWERPACIKGEGGQRLDLQRTGWLHTCIRSSTPVTDDKNPAEYKSGDPSPRPQDDSTYKPVKSSVRDVNPQELADHERVINSPPP